MESKRRLSLTFKLPKTVTYLFLFLFVFVFFFPWQPVWYVLPVPLVQTRKDFPFEAVNVEAVSFGTVVGEVGRLE